jgi:hypothetical protein
MLLSVFPRYPSTLAGWVGLMALALPVTLVGEFVGSLFWRNRVAQVIEQRTAGSSLSWLRIGYGFVVILLVFSAAFGWAIILAVKV